MAGPPVIVIVGGGYSGASTAIHLARRAGRALHIVLVEPRGVAGPGLAHSTREPDHRLNAPDAIHSPYVEAPDHFAEWMRTSGALAADPGAVAGNGLVFARRGDFGRYLAAELDACARTNPSGSRIEHRRGAACRVRADARGCEVVLDDGTVVRARHAVLALGWDDAGVPAPLAPLVGGPGWYGDPWAVDRLSDIASDARVLLVGAGLTACDTFAALRARGHRGPVLALSRHGLRPASQNPHRPAGSFWDRLLDPMPPFLRRHGTPRSVAQALRALRADIATVEPRSESWHGRFDDLRDAAHAFWPQLPAHDRARYVRHLKSRYDAARFRNPPQVERIVADGIAGGQLGFAAGRLVEAFRESGAVRLVYLDRHRRSPVTGRFDAVVNCTGPQVRPSASARPLWRTMIADGTVRDDACGVGIEVDTADRVVDARGVPSASLSALGPPTAGSLGEVTSVPHVALRVRSLVERLVARCA